jgi:hypothetical protein
MPSPPKHLPVEETSVKRVTVMRACTMAAICISLYATPSQQANAPASQQ